MDARVCLLDFFPFFGINIYMIYLFPFIFLPLSSFLCPFNVNFPIMINEVSYYFKFSLKTA